MEENLYRVYVKVNEYGVVTAINSSAFLSDTTGWTEIDNGTSDRYHHAQGNYLDKPIVDENGSYNYKLVDGTVKERTAEEKALDPKPQPVPSTEEQLAQAQEQIAMLTDCIMEMSEIIYA